MSNIIDLEIDSFLICLKKTEKKFFFFLNSFKIIWVKIYLLFDFFLKLEKLHTINKTDLNICK